MHETIRISRALYLQLLRRLRYRENREFGGLLRLEDGEITDFYSDERGEGTPESYTPCREDMERMLRTWQTQGAAGCFVHSHPPGRGISRRDRAFAEAYLEHNKLAGPLLFFILIDTALCCYAISAGRID